MTTLVCETLNEYKEAKFFYSISEESKEAKAKQAITALEKQLKDAKKPGAFNTTAEKKAKIKELEEKIAKWKSKLSESLNEEEAKDKEQKDSKKPDVKKDGKGEDNKLDEVRMIGDKIIKRIVNDYKGLVKSLGPASEKSTLVKIKNLLQEIYKTGEQLNSEFLKAGGNVSIPFEISTPLSKKVKAPILYPMSSGNYVVFICDDSESGARQLCIKGGEEDIISRDKKTILDFIAFVKEMYKEFKNTLVNYTKEKQKQNVDAFLKTNKSGGEKSEGSKKEDKKEKEDKDDDKEE